MVVRARKVVGARELKARLGTYLRDVREGIAVVVTERGRPVAEIVPIARSRSPVRAHLEELASRGEMTLAEPGALVEVEPVRISGGSLSRTISDDREDRF